MITAPIRPPPARTNVAFFRGLDQIRRLNAAWFDMAGLTPEETPSVVLRQDTGLRLKRYFTAEKTPDGPALLIVPAPIKRHHIWDFVPSCSVVRHALARGCDVYMAQWTQAPPNWGLDNYVGAIQECAEQIEHATQRAPHVLGHSLGGTLGALHSARYPSQARSLVLVEAPVHFGQGGVGAFESVLARAPTAASLSESYGHVPGSILNLAAVMASPKEFVWDQHLDGLSAAMQGRDAFRRHLLAVRWTLDEAPLPGKLFEQVVDGLYRADQFMQGTLTVRGQQVAPQQVSVPLTAIVDLRSRVVPAESVTGFLDAVPGSDKLLLHYASDVGVGLQHLGALVGTGAHRTLWPRIFDRLQGIDGRRPASAELQGMEGTA